MNYSLKTIYASLPPEKRRADSLITRCILRPLSVPVAWLFLAIGFTPNRVTALSAVCCLAALALSFFPSLLFHGIAFSLFIFFSVLDCTDGAMARTIGKTNPYGDWVDAAGGYFAYFALPAAMANATALPGQGILSIPGTAIQFTGFSAIPGIWILIAFFSVAANFMMRLLHQTFKNTEIKSGSNREPGKEKRLSEEVGITGLMPFLYGAGLVTKTLPWVLLAYLALYGLGFLAIAVKLSRRITVLQSNHD